MEELDDLSEIVAIPFSRIPINLLSSPSGGVRIDDVAPGEGRGRLASQPDRLLAAFGLASLPHDHASLLALAS